MFYLTTHSTHFLTVIWRQTYGKDGLLFPISNKSSFICIIAQTGQYISLLNQLWSTGWNEKYLNGSTMKDRSEDPSHDERTLLPRSYISLLTGYRRKDFLFNDALSTFYIRLYGVIHMVQDHSDSLRGNPLPPLHGILFSISSKGSFISIIPQTG